MAKSKNYFSPLTRQMSGVQSGAASIDKLLKASQAGQGGKSSTLSRGADGLRASANDGGKQPKGIQFGNPSSRATAASSSGSIWPNLLKQTATGGLASFLGGGSGIGSLVSGLLHLFGGGKSAPPPLVKFQLPSPQEQTVYVGANGTSSYTSSAAQSNASTASPAPGGSNSLQYQSSDIAQAVKTALLNSSSLNDVISEL